MPSVEIYMLQGEKKTKKEVLLRFTSWQTYRTAANGMGIVEAPKPLRRVIFEQLRETITFYDGRRDKKRKREST
jgi:hypothetical protein